MTNTGPFLGRLTSYWGELESIIGSLAKTYTERTE